MNSLWSSVAAGVSLVHTQFTFDGTLLHEKNRLISVFGYELTYVDPMLCRTNLLDMFTSIDLSIYLSNESIRHGKKTSSLATIQMSRALVKFFLFLASSYYCS
jgi:hypothetical protein